MCNTPVTLVSELTPLPLAPIPRLRYKRAKGPPSMRRLLYLALLLSGLCTAALAQKPENAPAAKSAERSADKDKTDKKDYSQEAFVIEQVRSRLRFESDGTGRKETVARVRVQSEAGVEQWGQVVIGYNSANERVEIPYVRVLKKDGTVVTAPAEADRLT